MKTNKLIQFWSILLVFLTMLGVGETWGGTYNKITSLSALTTGDYVIVGQKAAYSWGRLIYSTMNDGRIAYTEHYDSSLPSSITTTTANEIWTLTVSGTGDSRTVTIYNSGQSKYLCSSGKSSSWCSSDGTEYTVTYSSGFQFYVSTDDYLGVNSSATWWRDYASTTLYSTYCITLYKEVTDPYTVTFNKQGGTFDDPSFDSDNTLTEVSAGAGVTLPAVSPSSACASEGWKFYGWKETSAVSSSTTTAPTIVGKAGDTYYPISDITLHAVFVQGDFSKVNSITSGAKYLIVTNYSSKNYIMTDSYSLNEGEGQMGSEQIDETSGKYHAADIDINWCYTIEDGETSGKYYIRDVKHGSSANYVDIAYKDWYGKGVDDGDEWELTQSSGDWTLKNEYHPNYLGFNGTNKVFVRTTGTTFYLYKAGTINYYSTPSCCANEVSVSESGSSHISSMTFSESSVATCSSTAADRQVTITVTPSSGYTLFGSTKPVFTKTSGTVTAAYVSGPTDNGNGTFSYIYQFTKDDSGAGTFAISPGQFTNYRTTCSTTYDITLDKNGGDAGGSAKVDADGTQLKSISAPTKTGYKVEGYYAESGKTNKVAATDGTLEKSVEISSTDWTNSDGEWIKESGATLYAGWTPISYEVRFNKNNGSATGTMSNESYDYDESKALTTNAFSLTGYTFQGWATTSDGSVAHTDGKSVSNLSTTDGAVVDLYAVWTANKYTLTLAATNETSSVGSQTVQATYGSAMPLKTTADGTPAVAALSRTGYTFNGWEYSSTQYYSYNAGTSTLSSAHAWDVASTATLTPRWSINSYTLTWNLDGGKVTVAGTGAAVDATGTPSSSVEYNAAITVPTVTKAGHTFAGWDVTPADNMPASNTTYTASWTALHDKYYDRMHANGASTEAGTGYKYDDKSGAGYTIPKPSDEDGETGNIQCEKAHYKFVGWVAASDLNDDGTLKSGYTIIAGGGTTDATGTTYYAVWGEDAE